MDKDVIERLENLEARLNEKIEQYHLDTEILINILSNHVDEQIDALYDSIKMQRVFREQLLDVATRLNESIENIERRIDG